MVIPVPALWCWIMLFGGLGVALVFGLVWLFRNNDVVGKIALGGLVAAGMGGFALLIGLITGG